MIKVLFNSKYYFGMFSTRKLLHDLINLILLVSLTKSALNEFCNVV